jgi:SAM-dependent methyltransferase
MSTSSPRTSKNRTPDTSDTSDTPNFDRLARPYRWLEYFSFGPLLQRTRTQFLGDLGGCRRALVLGDGDGRFSARLLRANLEIELHAVDASGGMLRVLAGRVQRAGHAQRLTVEQADLRRWMPNGGEVYDLVVTHFFLDCLTTAEAEDLACRVNHAAAPGALWLVSEFAVPRTGFGRLIAGPLVSGLYAAFRALTGLYLDRLPDYAGALAAAGWSLCAERRRLNGLLVSQLWRL